MQQDLTEPVPLDLPGGFVECVVSAAREAHDVEVRNHNPNEGSDGQTFGTGRWRRTWFYVPRRLHDAGYEVEWVNNVPRAVIANTAFTFYNGGLGGAWDPEGFDFAKSERRHLRTIRNELGLGFAPGTLGIDEPSAAEAVEAVFFFAATVDRGLEAAYLGVPVTQRRWEWLRRVWVHPPEDAGVIDSTSTTAKPTRFSDRPTVDPMVESLTEADEDGGTKE